MRAFVPLLCLGLALGALVPKAAACPPDDALDRVAAELAANPEASDDLRGLARRLGSDVTWVVALTITDGDAERRDRWLERVEARRRAPLRCGEAFGEGRHIVVAGPALGRLFIDDEGVLTASLPEGYGSPMVHARDARGRIWQRDLVTQMRVPADLERPVVVQVMAEGPDGPLPIAERWLGAPPRSSRSQGGAGSPAERLVRLRREAGVPSLRENRLLRGVAARHAEALCRAGRVAHHLGDGDPEARLARAGLTARHVGEIAARARDEGRAFDAALESPAHRAALVDRRFTDVGVGSARDASGARCLVVLFAAWPRPRG